MRIAHFIQRYPPALGGSEAYFARLSRHLAQHGEDVVVFTTNAVDLEAFWSRTGRTLPCGVTREDGVEVRRYPAWRWPARRYVLKALSLVPHLLWQCLTLPCNPVSPAMWRDAGRVEPRFDIVHASAFPYAWPIACARRLARRCRAPLVITPFLHIGDPADPDDSTRRGYTSPPLRWLLRQADVVLVQTPSEQQAAQDMGARADRVVLQGLGVDPAECTGGNRAAARTRWRMGETEIAVGHLANLSEEKGTIDLLEAVALLWRDGVMVHAVLAGPNMQNFRRFWEPFERRHPVESRTRVHRLGVLTDDQKRDFFAGIDLFCLPSRSDSFGLVLLEAWANGLPNIAYRAGGPADLIRHEADGLLVPCGDVAGLSLALERLGQTPGLRHNYGEAGRRRLNREFDWNQKLELVRDVYLSRTKL